MDDMQHGATSPGSRVPGPQRGGGKTLWWLLAVVLAFALDSVAHAVHRHDDSASSALTAHGPACGYCAAFDGLVDAPKHHYAPLGFRSAWVPVATTCPAST